MLARSWPANRPCTAACPSAQSTSVGVNRRARSTAAAILARIFVVPAAAAKGYAPDCWFCAEDVNKHGRPYPYMLFAAMQKMHVKAVADVIKVGDTAADIEEGIAAGVWTVGVVEGSSEMGLTEQEYQALNAAEQDDLKEKVAEAFWCYGADFVIDNISEIFDVIRLIETDLEEELDD